MAVCRGTGSARARNPQIGTFLRPLCQPGPYRVEAHSKRVGAVRIMVKTPEAGRSANGQRREYRSGIRDFHDELTRERVRTQGKLAGHDGLARSRRLRHRARAHVRHWHVGRKGWSVVSAGLGKVYGQGRDALEAVRNMPTDSALHEWRKQAKYPRHQLQLLRPIRPATLGGMVDDLHRLTNQLAMTTISPFCMSGWQRSLHSSPTWLSSASARLSI
jgi:CHAD domain